MVKRAYIYRNPCEKYELVPSILQTMILMIVLYDMVNQKSKPKFIPSLTSEPKVKSQEANKLKQKGFPFVIS